MNKILVCNQKMFLTYDEAVILNKELEKLNLDNINFIVCPSYLNFNLFLSFKLGSQDAFYEDKGAFTGEISAYDLSLRGIKYSLVGHSDRKKYDDEKTINLKVKALLRNSITPIICIGETKEEKELHKTLEVLRRQIKYYLKDIKLDNYEEIYIAYEPRYLIGGKNSLSKNEILDTLKYIKKTLDNLGVNNYKLLYGGAINSNNIKELNDKDIDGFLLGASSVDINELKEIIKCIKCVK